MKRRIGISGALFLPYLLIIISAGIYAYQSQKRERLETINRSQISDIKMAANSIKNQIELLRDELIILSESPSLQNAFQTPSKDNIKNVKQLFLSLANVRKAYVQIRWLDENGKEKVRVEGNGLHAFLTPDKNLQDKSHRYYFTHTMSLPPGEVYFSKFDLNMENGKIQIPYNPMLRAAIKIQDKKTGKDKGIIIINNSGQRILDIFSNQFTSTSYERTILLNQKGNSLTGLPTSFKWAVKPNSTPDFPTQYPAEWMQIKNHSSGYLKTDNGYFAYKRILYSTPANSPLSNELYAISFIPKYLFLKELSALQAQIISIELILAMLGLIISTLLSFLGIKKYELKKEQLVTRERNGLLDSLTEGIICVDHEGNCEYINQTALDYLGYKEEEILSKNIHKTLHYVKPSGEVYPERDCPVSDAIHKKTSIKMEDFLIKADSSFLQVNLASRPINIFSPNGSIVTFNDISDILEARKKVFQLSNYDALTKLPNREMLLNELHTHIRTIISSKQPALLVAFDISRFSDLNDSLGDSYGNLLLTSVSERLLQLARTIDIKARVGSDEFVILVHNMSIQKSITWLENALELLNKPYDLYGTGYKASFAVGCCILPKDGATGDEALHNAQIALSRAKLNKLDNIAYFSSEMREASLRRNKLEQDLKNALDKHELTLYYQPQINSANNTLIGAEALVRWEKDGEIISPAEFIPLAEETGVINLIDKFVIHEAIKQREAWLKNLPEEKFVLSINLSAKQFAAEDLPFTIANTLKRFNVPADLIGIEITENSMINNPDQTILVLHSLKKIGVKLYLDDFGTGYSSLSYLQNFLFDTIKIDRAFVTGVDTNPTNNAIIESVLTMSKAFSMTTVAEGVETKEEMLTLAKLGCHSIQGYFFSKPQSAKDFENWINQPKKT